ncbi:conjugative transposon protein [Clostridioides difficile]|nr:conjugative transposon protein [Clostridioides difficile]
MLKTGARAGDVSLVDIRANIEATIDEEMNSPAPEVQANFKKYFGNKRPTPEEYIYKITKKQKFDLRLFVACGVYQQISVKESAQKNRENKKRITSYSLCCSRYHQSYLE